MIERTRVGVRARLARTVALLGIVVVAGCGGGNPVSPPPPTPGAPTLTCPADLAVGKHQDSPAVVTFDTPPAQNGQPPVTVTCSPGSGTEFAPGVTAVTCTATDALARSGTCSFNVTVTQIPLISLTSFVAFGDSLTAGTISASSTLLVVSNPDSYPTKLQTLLSERYQDQSVSVLNEGAAGEHIAAGVTRLPGVLDADRPQVLLLLHGLNDLNDRQGAAIPKIIGGLEDMIKAAKRRGIRVFLANFPPENPDGKNGHGASSVPQVNAQIAALAKDEGADLVDLYNGFGTYVGYIGVDGLHPTPEGYTKMAEIWRDALTSKLEKPGTAAESLTRLLRLPSPRPR
jgi:lysophospholipase L1-like esterase